ncbi:hypothetical protein [Streptomyces sp. NPDC091209]
MPVPRLRPSLFPSLFPYLGEPLDAEGEGLSGGVRQEGAEGARR